MILPSKQTSPKQIPVDSSNVIEYSPFRKYVLYGRLKSFDYRYSPGLILCKW